MPAEPTRAKFKPRTSRKDLEIYKFDGSHGLKLELKRIRGQVSCAECRRLKIKCDKQIPCQSCKVCFSSIQVLSGANESDGVKLRGCEPLCPNGILATGPSPQSILAATEHLHRRIANLSARIRQLEDALSTLHAMHSSEPHPLLHEDLIPVDKRDGEVDGVAEEGSPQEAEVLDAFGTLSISEHGISTFFGPTGGSESLLWANHDSEHASPEISHTPDSVQGFKSPSSIDNLSLFSQSFPFTPMGKLDDVQELIESYLPSYERALALCETYFEQVSWFFHGVTRLQLIDDMLPIIYKRQTPPPGEDHSGPHDLSLIFMILATGSLVELEPKNALGEHFHQIARAAISLQPVLEKPSIVTIQTLHLMGIYNTMSDLKSETSMEMMWSLIALSSHLSQTIGLHCDSARWGLTPKMVERRRILFWDVFVADVWKSLSTGRPPSFSLAYIDCSYLEYRVEDGFRSAFELWQCRSAAECVAEVTARTLTAEAPTYATIMELDRKVRDFPLPAGFSKSSDDLGDSFQQWVLEHTREAILLYIHRSFFAQAIIEHPVNPLRSVYAPSFLAAYRASSTILKSVREQFNIWPNSSRFWQIWTFAFSAAVVFGTVVTRGPRSPLAQSAMTELEQACALFSKASVYNIRVTKALSILIKLSEKAHHALASVQSDPSPIFGDKSGVHWNIERAEDPHDELSIFAGHTRFVSPKRGADSSNPSPPDIRLARPPPLYPTSLNQQLHSSETQPLDISDTRSLPVISSNYQPPLDLAEPHSSSLSISPSKTWSSTLQSSDQYSMSNQHHSYVPLDKQPSSNPVPENTYGWLSGSAQQPSHHLVDITPPYEQLVQPDNYEYLQPQQHRQQYHVHAAHANSVGWDTLHPYAPYASQNPPQHHNPQHVPSSSQQPHQYSSPQSGQYTTGAPGYHPQAGGSTTLDLADLGLASRHSRLDEMWRTFMADSGLLGDF